MKAWQPVRAMKKARALRMIRRLKTAEAEVSDWEGEFLQSVETRLDTYGRAFADPQKGARDSAVSTMQQRKLKEIGAKLSGEPSASRPPRRGLTRHKPLGGRLRPIAPEEEGG